MTLQKVLPTIGKMSGVKVKTQKSVGGLRGQQLCQDTFGKTASGLTARALRVQNKNSNLFAERQVKDVNF